MKRLLHIAFCLLLAAPSWAATTTISGSANIEDARINSDAVVDDYNYGANTTMGCGANASNGTMRSVVTIAQSSLPAGTVTAFTASMYQFGGSVPTNAQNVDAFRIAAANAGIDCGDNNGTAADSGEVTWLKQAHAQQDWAGAAGCSTSGTDFVAGASTHQFPSLGVGWQTFTLNAAWVNAWIQDSNNNAGILYKNQDEADTGQQVYWHAMENANPMTFTITYWPSTGAILAHPL